MPLVQGLKPDVLADQLGSQADHDRLLKICYST
jgi:hypothetical protein